MTPAAPDLNLLYFDATPDDLCRVQSRGCSPAHFTDGSGHTSLLHRKKESISTLLKGDVEITKRA